MATFDPSGYGPHFGPRLTGSRLRELGPGAPDPACRADLMELQNASFEPPPGDPLCAKAAVAGVWLVHDFLDESHTISQDIHNATGSFWHAIMHRREPDAWNSKYWWRRVGDHPVLDQLSKQAPSLGYDFRSPVEFVDFCEQFRGTGSQEETLARRVQQLEWELLFDYCYREAFG